MVWRSELGEREAVEGRELFLLMERRQRWGGEYRKSTTPPQSSWRESVKVETVAGTEQKRKKGERRRFKFH